MGGWTTICPPGDGQCIIGYEDIRGKARMSEEQAVREPRALYAPKMEESEDIIPQPEAGKA